MRERHLISQELREHYEEVWRAGDAWALETSEFERCRYAHLLGLLQGRRYAKALEIGCGSGCFTRLLAGLADHVLGLDIAAGAIERARRQTAAAGPGAVELRVADVMHFDPLVEGPWDLVVLSETIYGLGWLYSFFDVAYLAARLFDATRPGGRLLLANTYGHKGMSWPRQPWVIDTYHDLLGNVGFGVQSQDIFRGIKEEVDLEVRVTLFEKPAHGATWLTEEGPDSQGETSAAGPSKEGGSDRATEERHQ
jgi:SAM-dependent methyltransferase